MQLILSCCLSVLFFPQQHALLLMDDKDQFPFCFPSVSVSPPSLTQFLFPVSALFFPHPLSTFSFCSLIHVFIPTFIILLYHFLLFPSFTSFISLLLPHPFWLSPYSCLVILYDCHPSFFASHFLSLLFYLNPLLTHTTSPSLSSSQGGCSGLPASAAGGPGGERADGDSGGKGGDVAGRVSAHPHPDQWGADPHPPGATGPGWHRAISHGEERGWSCGSGKPVCIQTFVCLLTLGCTNTD